MSVSKLISNTKDPANNTQVYNRINIKLKFIFRNGPVLYYKNISLMLSHILYLYVIMYIFTFFLRVPSIVFRADFIFI